MSIQDIQDSKLLREQGKRLGREGLSERVHSLVKDYIAKWPDGHYKEAIALAGRLRAIALAANADCYWREKCHRGFSDELFDITKFEKPEVSEDCGINPNEGREP